MLNNAADYRYITNSQPIAAGIRGGILPVRDGTAPACIETYEDYCYLVEMAREREHWARGEDIVLPIADDFDQTCLVAEETPLHDLAVAAAGGISDFSQDAYSALIGKDAVMTGQTFYGRGSIPGISESVPYYALGQMQSILGVPRATPSNYALPHIVEAETLRYLYYDLGNMKRYLFRSLSGPHSSALMTPSEFAAYTGPWGRNVFGPVSDSDSSSTWPYYGEIHEKVNGSWQTRVDAEGANLTFYIKAPFWKNPSGTAYYSTVTPYTHWNITVGWWDPTEQVFKTGYGYIIDSSAAAVSVLAHSGAHDDVFEGKTRTISFAANGMYMRFVYTLAKTWVVNQIGQFDDNYSWNMDVQLREVFLDTGVIDHVTNLPSSWTWQPSS